MDDAVSVRHSLELARSLAAKVWDNSAFQMKQIDMIGDAGVRKLVQAGINSVETLQNTEPHRIELALGRHPPFGQKVLAKAVEFPNLRVSVKQMGKERNPGQLVKIKFKADIGFVNEKVPLIFRKKPVYVCFMAETSDGRLIDFRRFAARKLENGQEIRLSVQLTNPATSINCHIMCDEIAGTSRRAELVLEHFTASYFPVPYFPAPEPVALEPRLDEASAKASFRAPHDFDDFGDIDDADLLAACDNEEGIEVVHDIDKLVEDSKALEKRPLKRKASKITADDEGDPATFKEPVQLENGRWTCQHLCKKQGKTCKHKCCVKGVEKPKKVPKKNTTVQEEADATVSDISAKTSPFEKARLQSKVKKQVSTATSSQKVGKPGPRRKTEQGAKSPPLSQIFAHRHEKGKAPKLSSTQDPYRLSKTTKEDGADDAVFDFDRSDLMDDLGDWESLKAGTGDRESSSRPEENNVHKKPDQQCWYGANPAQDDPDEGSGAIDDDIRFEAAGSDVHGSNDDQMGTSKVKITAANVQSPDSDASAVDLDNECDFGAFAASLAHITAAATRRWASAASTASTHSNPVVSTDHEKQKGLFITGGGSSPQKSLQKAPGADVTEEYFADSAVEAFFAEMESVDYRPFSPPAKKRKLSPNNGGVSSSPKTRSYLQCSSARTSPSLRNMPREPLTTLQNDPVGQLLAVKGDMVVNAAGELFETQDERHKRLADEEQKKKWEGFEDFYEEFGEFVEII